MKFKNVCSKCSSEDIFYSEKIVDRGKDDEENALCLGLNRWEAIQGSLGGTLEAYSCKKCGFTEFYVKRVEELKS